MLPACVIQGTGTGSRQSSYCRCALHVLTCKTLTHRYLNIYAYSLHHGVQIYVYVAKLLRSIILKHHSISM